jgi:hypothetical protein
MLKETIKVTSDISPEERDHAISPHVREVMMTCFEGMHYYGSQVGFSLTLKGIEWAQKEVAPEGFTYTQLRPVLAELERRVNDELELVLFLHVPAENAKYYPTEDRENKFTLLSRRARQKFAKSIEDADEAAKCIALGRYTASVFHMMRIMERGIQRLGKKLKVQIDVEEKDWGAIAIQIGSALKHMPNTTLQEKKRHTAFARAAAYLENVREAWRNPTMHPKETYTEDEAQDIFSFVRQFVEHLAKIV